MTRRKSGAVNSLHAFGSSLKRKNLDTAAVDVTERPKAKEVVGCIG
jgi:hypothetical protein